MDRCVACGADLGVGRFCLNCGHPIGAPVPVREAPVTGAQAPASTSAPAAPAPVAQSSVDPTIAPPVQAADPTPVSPTSPPDLPDEPATGRPEWDPRVELLPYEEVDDLDGETPIRGRAWIAWVVGAILLVAVVVLLLRVLGTASDDVATDRAGDATSAATEDDAEQTPDEATSEAPRGVGPRMELVTGATFEVPGTGPPTTDFDGNLVAYEASQMADGDLATTWRTAGDATGQTITITLAQPSVVTRVGLVNGYAKQVAGVDWYPNNRRILAVTWGFDDATSVEQTFAERPAMQRLKVPPVQTGTVTIAIRSVTPPGSGSLGRDYTAISEVTLTGRRAG